MAILVITLHAAGWPGAGGWERGGKQTNLGLISWQTTMQDLVTGQTREEERGEGRPDELQSPGTREAFKSREHVGNPATSGPPWSWEVGSDTYEHRTWKCIGSSPCGMPGLCLDESPARRAPQGAVLRGCSGLWAVGVPLLQGHSAGRGGGELRDEGVSFGNFTGKRKVSSGTGG